MTTSAEQWLGRIARYKREMEDWERRVERIIERYSDTKRQGSKASQTQQFNILWSNVQTLFAATFARMPKVSVARRFSDRDPVGRVASLILERALTYEIEHHPDYRDALSGCLLDRLLGGRGVAWVRYEPHMTQEPVQGAELDGIMGLMATGGELPNGVLVTEDEIAREVLDYERAPCDYVHWRDFGHYGGKRWEELTAVWRCVYMTRRALVERFGEEGETVPLDGERRGLTSQQMEQEKRETACIYEVWDRDTKRVLWIAKSSGKVMDERDDPLQLEQFFPCSALYGTLSNDSLIPTPDYAQYQDQAQSLDVLATRVNQLARTLKVSGLYDASVPEIKRLFSEGGNATLIPVNNWMALTEKGGLNNAVNFLDLAPVAQALGQCFGAFEQAKAQVYEITGISDIVRGQSAASETATAQQIKGQYASLRLRQYQDGVAHFATSLLRHKAEIMCRFFSPETLLQMSVAEGLSEQDKAVIPQAMALLKGAPVLRQFRIEVAADSLVAGDEQAEKDDRVEFLGAVSGFLERAVMAGQAAPEMVPLLAELLKFGVAAFRGGAQLEGVIDDLMDRAQTQQQAMQAAQPPMGALPAPGAQQGVPMPMQGMPIA